MKFIINNKIKDIFSSNLIKMCFEKNLQITLILTIRNVIKFLHIMGTNIEKQNVIILYKIKLPFYILSLLLGKKSKNN